MLVCCAVLTSLFPTIAGDSFWKFALSFTHCLSLFHSLFFFCFSASPSSQLLQFVYINRSALLCCYFFCISAFICFCFCFHFGLLPPPNLFAAVAAQSAASSTSLSLSTSCCSPSSSLSHTLKYFRVTCGFLQFTHTLTHTHRPLMRSMLFSAILLRSTPCLFLLVFYVWWTWKTTWFSVLATRQQSLCGSCGCRCGSYARLARSLTHYVDAISAERRVYLYISASAICVASSGSSSSNLHTSMCVCDTRLQAALPFAY